jgi:nitric oxide reductase NorE protein
MAALGRRLSRPDLRDRAGALWVVAAPVRGSTVVRQKSALVERGRERTAIFAWRPARVIAQRWSGNDRSPRYLGKALMSSAVMSPEDDTQLPPVGDLKRRLPGVEGVWVFVMADMTVFAVLFGFFVLGRHKDPALFEASRHALNPNFGGVNTLILLTSSWFAALALDAVRRSRFGLAQRFLGGAFLCGLAFAVSKAIEYTEKLNAGISLLTNDFFMYYFTLTGIHLFHVIAGSIVLLVLWFKARSRSFDPQRPVVLECGAIYWHMVDLLWIFLFPLLYLVR